MVGVATLVVLAWNPFSEALHINPAKSELANLEARTIDPVKAMETLVREFPRRYRTPKGSTIGIGNVAFNVKKTDSLVTPIVGTVDSSEAACDFEYVFHWRQNRWVFSRLICLDNGMDHTNTSGGNERWESPEFRVFLAKYR